MSRKTQKPQGSRLRKNINIYNRKRDGILDNALERVVTDRIVSTIPFVFDSKIIHRTYRFSILPNKELPA